MDDTNFTGGKPTQKADAAFYDGHMADSSGTVATGGTAQTVLPQALTENLRYLLIVNQSIGVLYVDFDQTATAASIPLKACGVAGDGSGGALEYGPGGGGFIPQGPMSVLGATTGQAFTVKTG